MRRGRYAFAALALLALAGCPSPPPPPPGFDAASPEPAAADVCTHLLALSCAEGLDQALCTRKLSQAAADRITTFPTRCWLAASSRSEARSCGQIACSEPAP